MIEPSVYFNYEYYSLKHHKMTDNPHFVVKILAVKLIT